MAQSSLYQVIKKSLVKSVAVQVDLLSTTGKL